MALRFALLVVALGVAEVGDCSGLPCWLAWPELGKVVVSGGSRHTRVVEIWQLGDQPAAWQRKSQPVSQGGRIARPDTAMAVTMVAWRILLSDCFSRV